mgnify:CR=1 FL=1
MWVEGAFLRPQHFQQQDRRAASAITGRAAMAQPFHWGFETLALDETALGQGLVAIRSCSGAFQDGEPFSYPDEIAGPLSVAIPPGTASETVWLIAPAMREGGLPLLHPRCAPLLNVHPKLPAKSMN